MRMITLEIATSRLADDGAVLEMLSNPPRHFLVGEVRWIDSNHLFWFTAHGDREDDGHILEFDTAEFMEGRIEFYSGGQRVGLLTQINAAAVDDPEDYAVAFALWQQVAPRTQPLIERSCARYELAS